MMIDNGAEACFMKDKKGYLPAHVACSRHCSPEKLRMLLAVNPAALYETTNEGKTLLDLANQTATKSHPNYALIDELQRQLHDQTMDHPLEATTRVSSEEEDSIRDRLDSNDSAKSWVPTLEEIPQEGAAFGGIVPQPIVSPRIVPPRPVNINKRRRAQSAEPDNNAVDLLLNFSRNGSPRASLDDEAPSRVAAV
jgi:hypothetical protein